MKHLLDKYKTLKSQKQYLKIIAANIINRFGDSIDAIAFTWLVYELTSSPVWSTIIFGLNMVPTIIIQPLAGALVEKMRKKNIMVLCDIARGVLVAFIAICYMMNILTPWLLVVVTLLNSTFEALRVPAGLSFVPKLLEKEYYEIGTAMNSSLSRGMELIGTGCAGFIIGVFGISSAILIDAFTFFGSAIIIFFIKYQEQITHEKLSIKSYMDTLKEGISYVKARQAVLMLCFIGALINMVNIPISSFLPAYIDVIMKSGSEMLSALSLGLTLGSILGSFLYPLLINYITRRRLLLITVLSSGIFYIAIIYLPSMIPIRVLSILCVLIMFTLMGFLCAAVSTFAGVFLMEQVDQDYMARVGAVFNSLVTLTIPLGTFLITLLLQVTSFIWIMIGTGILAGVIFILLAARKSFYLLDKKQEDKKCVL